MVQSQSTRKAAVVQHSTSIATTQGGGVLNKFVTIIAKFNLGPFPTITFNSPPQTE